MECQRFSLGRLLSKQQPTLTNGCESKRSTPREHTMNEQKILYLLELSPFLAGCYSPIAQYHQQSLPPLIRPSIEHVPLDPERSHRYSFQLATVPGRYGANNST